MDQPPAALPRALDVQRFAGAREQEIRALCSALKGSQLGAKFGVAALPRHLRRRAGSHKPYQGHRFRVNAKLQGKRLKLSPEAGVVGVEQPGDSGGEADAAASARPFTNRRMRRQPSLLLQQHRNSAAWTAASLAASAVDDTAVSSAAGAAGSSGSGSGSTGGVRRLETHIWHAKRLAMEERYGWLLPAGAAGQGRGSRSFVHVARASCLIHDASYLCPLLLSGAWDGVQAVLSAILAPPDSAALESDWTAMGSGGNGSSSRRLGWEQDVVLHSPGQYPWGAICPARLLTSPSHCGSDVQAMEAAGGEPDGVASAASGQLPGSSTSSRAVQACLWIHPAAAAEAHVALQQAVAQLAPAGTGSQVSIAVLNVRRLEFRGGAADRALPAALAGATAASVLESHRGTSAESRPEQQAHPQSSVTALSQQQQQQPAVSLPPVLAAMQHGDVVALSLPDPRLQKPVVVGGAAASLLQEAPAPSSAAAGLQQHLQQLPVDVCQLLQAPLPMSEAELSTARQQLRLRMLHLGPASVGTAASSGAGGGQQRQLSRAQQLDGDQQAQVQRRGFCPALLVRHDPPEDAGIPGWSLVLPAGWVPPFWLAAAYACCKPAGQREWRWLQTLQRRPSFPWDFPDTAAYAALMRQQHLQRGAAQARRPKGKQALAGPPCPPPWDELAGQLRRGSGVVQAAEQRQQQQQQQASRTGPEAQQAQRLAAREQQQQEAMELEPPAAPGAAAAQLAGTTAEAAAAPAAAAALPAVPPAATAAVQGGAAQKYVARSYSAMAAALGGSSEAGAAGLPSGTSRPVTAALRQGLLQWRPKQQQPEPASAAAQPCSTGSSTCMGSGSSCLLEASVQPIKTGTAAEGAAVCLVAGREAVRQRTPLQVLSAKQQRRRAREAERAAVVLAEVGGNPAEASTLSLVAQPTGRRSSSSTDVPAEAVHVIGYVLTEAPRGAPRRCGSIAAVAAAPAWGLRALQHWASRQDDGAIEAFVRNPGSATLYPVRLRLLAEQQV